MKMIRKEGTSYYYSLVPYFSQNFATIEAFMIVAASSNLLIQR